MKKFIFDVVAFCWEVMIMSVFLMCASLALAMAYLIPNNGIMALITSVIIVGFPKLYKKFIKKQEE